MHARRNRLEPAVTVCLKGPDLAMLVGEASGWLGEKLGGQRLERIAAKELAKKITIPVVDDQTAFVARGLQMIGISLWRPWERRSSVLADC